MISSRLRGSRRAGGRKPPALIWGPALLVGAAMLLPPGYLVLRASEAGAGGVLEIALDTSSLAVLGRSVLLAVLVTALSVTVAVPLAWLTTRTNLPGRRAWTVLAALPLVIPSYVGAFVLVSVLGPRGILQDFLAPLGVERLPSIYGLPGTVLVLVLFTYPYVFLTVRSALGGIDPSLEEAARGLGSSQLSTFFKVTLLQLRPAIAAGALLVALYTLSDFGVVSLLQYDSFTREIYLQYRSAFDRTPAAVLALMLVALVCVVLFLESLTRGRAAYHAGSSGARPHQPVALGRWQLPALAYCGGVVLLALAAPVGVLVFWLLRGLSSGESLNPVVQTALNSLQVSAMAAGFAVLAALPVAVLAARHRSRAASLLEGLTYTGFALPGIVLALALVFFGANVFPVLYQTLPLLLFAYVVHFMPQAVGAIRSSLLQARPTVEEAARGLGRSTLGVLATVTVPLARRGILAGAALVFLTTMKELPATLLLGPTGFATLATQIWNATSEAFFARAAAPALVLILISALPMYLLVIRERAK